MAVRGALLAILTLGPAYANQLAAEFERRTGEPLNAGQVTATLARCERDGVIRALPREEGRDRFALTPAGEAEAAAWFLEPAEALTGRDGPAAKVALAATLPGVGLPAVIGVQRRAFAEAQAALDLAAAAGASPISLASPPLRGRRPRAADSGPR